MQWDDFFAPVIDHIFCTVTFSDGSHQDAPDFTVIVRGIGVLSMTGSSAIQQCCTNRETYSVSNFVDGDVFNWTYPNGWGVSGASNASTIDLIPDYSTGGTVQCTVRISSAPTSYFRTISINVSRPAPVINQITYNVIPCVGTQVTFSFVLLCGFKSVSWSFPNDWYNASYDGTSATVTVVSSGNVTINVTFFGGCTVSYTQYIAVLNTPPGKPKIIYGGCTPIGCYTRYRRVCADNGTILSVAAANDVDNYNCTVTPPWILTDQLATSNTGSSITVVAAHINDVVISLPYWNSTNLNVLTGTYSVQAENCQGTSAWDSYAFHREADWWCDCEQYNPCDCPPVWHGHDPCHQQRLASPQNNQDINNQSTSDEVFNSVNIYPNPSNGSYTIEMTEGNKQINITDISGRSVFNKFTAVSKLNIDISSGEAGIYFVTVKSDSQVSKNKIVLQK
jgi:hypothetical protein